MSADEGDGSMVDPGELNRIAAQTWVNARALLLDDPQLGFGRSVGPEDFPRPGVFAPRPDELSESVIPPVPVLLFEPAEALSVRDPGSGLLYELQTEMIIAAGLPRVGPVAVFAEPTGFIVVSRGNQVQLCAADGGLWAEGEPDPSPRWFTELRRNAGWLVAFYGMRLGVRVPPGSSPATYPPEARAAEFRSARAAGLVAGGLVRWQQPLPDPDGEHRSS